MSLENYKVVLQRQADGSWAAEIPSISGCSAVMPTRKEALRELSQRFESITSERSETPSR